MDAILKEIGTVVVPATTARFVAREKFVRNGTVKISFPGSNFQKWFLAKTEEPLAETELRIAKLTKPSMDGPILTELGEKGETTLAQIYALMERQANGEEGVLLTNMWANAFYIRDVNGTLRAVGVRWASYDWHVFADLLGTPDGLLGVDQVLSRNS